MKSSLPKLKIECVHDIFDHIIIAPHPTPLPQTDNVAEYPKVYVRMKNNLYVMYKLLYWPLMCRWTLVASTIIFKILQRFSFKNTNISGELMLCINIFLFILVEVIRIWTVAVYYSQLWPVILISFMTPKGSWPTKAKSRLLCVTGYLFTCKLGTRLSDMKIQTPRHENPVFNDFSIRTTLCALILWLFIENDNGV